MAGEFGQLMVRDYPDQDIEDILLDAKAAIRRKNMGTPVRVQTAMDWPDMETVGGLPAEKTAGLPKGHVLVICDAAPAAENYLELFDQADLPAGAPQQPALL